MNTTVPGIIWIVAVEGRLDDLYAFSSEAEAERFADAVYLAGGDSLISDLPLNLNAAHTDALIASEVDDDDQG